MADLQQQQSENRRGILSLQSRFNEHAKVGDRYRHPQKDPFGPAEGGDINFDVQQATRFSLRFPSAKIVSREHEPGHVHSPRILFPTRTSLPLSRNQSDSHTSDRCTRPSFPSSRLSHEFPKPDVQSNIEIPVEEELLQVTETQSHDVDLQPQCPQIAAQRCQDDYPQPESAQGSQVAESHSQNVDPQPESPYAVSETKNQVLETTTDASQYVDASSHDSPNGEVRAIQESYVPELPGEIVVGPPPCLQNDAAGEITRESTAPTRTDRNLSPLGKARRKKAAILEKRKGATAQRAARLNKGKMEGSQPSRVSISQPFPAQVFPGQLFFKVISR